MGGDTTGEDEEDEEDEGEEEGQVMADIVVGVSIRAVSCLDTDDDDSTWLIVNGFEEDAVE
jgi:hypothetical protein